MSTDYIIIAISVTLILFIISATTYLAFLVWQDSHEHAQQNKGKDRDLSHDDNHFDKHIES